MSAKQPAIKFSPFEALLIGEKNKILKRQPMKNTIFVTRINQRSKSINLRDLFGLDKNNKKPENTDIVFKIPQRVHEFLKNRKLKNKTNVSNVHKSRDINRDILCYEFEGQKMILKNHNQQELKDKKVKLKSNKVKFKKKVNRKDKIKQNVGRMCCNGTRRNYRCTRNKNVIPRVVLRGIKKRRYNGNRHLLRGKDGKFICKSEYEKLKSNNISTKQKYITNYLHHLYLKNNKRFCSNEKLSNDENLNGFHMSYTIDEIVGIPKIHKQFDLPVSETMLNEVSRKYYENNIHEDFQFPKYPNQVNATNFEDDSNLIDIVYESLPKPIRFASRDFSDDFSDALINSEILTFHKNLKIYGKKKNEFVKSQTVNVILDNHISCINLGKVNNLSLTHSYVKNSKKSHTIDEPFTTKNHLITGKGLRSLFFRSAEGKDIFIGNLVKPFLQNSWFGSLPEF